MIHLPSYFFFIAWEVVVEGRQLLHVLFSFWSSVPVSVCITCSNNDDDNGNNKIQVHNTFTSDANFIVDFVGGWIRLVFTFLLVKLISPSKFFSAVISQFSPTLTFWISHVLLLSAHAILAIYCNIKTLQNKQSQREMFPWKNKGNHTGMHCSE